MACSEQAECTVTLLSMPATREHFNASGNLGYQVIRIYRAFVLPCLDIFKITHGISCYVTYPVSLVSVNQQHRRYNDM